MDRDKILLSGFSDNPFPELVFVDCEASSLFRPSFPVEVGVARCDGNAEGYLVKPVPAWDDYEWAPESEKIHGIARSEAEQHGRSVEWHAQWLNEQFRDKVILSDNPDYEAYWLGELFDAASVIPEFEITYSVPILKDFVFDAFGPTIQSVDHINAMSQIVMKQFPVTHRAPDDALFWAMLFRMATSED